MRSISAALKAHYALGSTTLATCWKATLTNGTVVAATSHDSDIVFEGLTYQSVSPFSPSDVENGSEFNPDNLELQAFLASPGITEADLHSGAWDYASIEMFEVNYADPSMGRNLIRSGTLGEVRAGRSSFTAELRGLMQAYSRRIVRLTTKECTADLGDSRCGVNLATWTVTGTITGVTNNRQFNDSARAEAASYFAGGLLTWTGGANAGLRMEVKSFAGAGVFTLVELMPFEVAVGDTYSAYRGCAKRFNEDCVAAFSNGANFRGFPHLPGTDAYKGAAR